MHSLKNNYEVIAVDLDGTLIFSDVLHESAIGLIRKHPLILLKIPFWLIKGKAYLKSKLASLVDLDVANLPYNYALIDWLKDQRASGKKIVLCTASDHLIATKISNFLKLFEDVISSDGVINNSSNNKRIALEAKFGVKRYDYVGNSNSDLEAWSSCRYAVVVNSTDTLIEKVKKVTAVLKVFPKNQAYFSDWVRLFRIHQWLKNLLLFIPIIAAHQVENIQALSTLIIAFISFCACASSVYIANDLLDLEHDRRHPRKRFRPLACAKISIKIGVLLAPLLAILSFILALTISPSFAAWLVFYFLLSSSYSLWLKRLVLVDCLILAALYTIRIIAGGTAVLIPISFWLLAFSVFIFLSLAFVKRYAELMAQQEAGNSIAHGRGYQVNDASLVQTLGIAAGYAAILLLALYLHSETINNLYSNPEFIWFAISLMLFWISWVWMKAHRSLMHDDPIVFAIKDKASIVVAFLIALSFIFAI